MYVAFKNTETLKALTRIPARLSSFHLFNAKFCCSTQNHTISSSFQSCLPLFFFPFLPFFSFRALLCFFIFLITGDSYFTPVGVQWGEEMRNNNGEGRRLPQPRRLLDCIPRQVLELSYIGMITILFLTWGKDYKLHTSNIACNTYNISHRNLPSSIIWLSWGQMPNIYISIVLMVIQV